MTQQIIEHLSSLDEASWIEYVVGLCNGTNPSPSLKPISLMLNEQLFWVYNVLNRYDKKAKLIFTKSLIRFLRTIPSNSDNANLVHTIILFIHETEPLEHRSLIESLVRENSFSNLWVGETNLNLLLIKSYIYIEDPENRYLEEFLTYSSLRNQPYYLYLITYYYCYLGYKEKALESFAKCFADSNTNLNKEYCDEVYYTLKECVPDYIDITAFIKSVIDKRIMFDTSNKNLEDSLQRYIDYLKETIDLSVAYFVEDVLKGNLLNYENHYFEIFNTLDGDDKISQLKHRYYDEQEVVYRNEQEQSAKILITNFSGKNDFSESAEIILNSDLAYIDFSRGENPEN
jgi:hypothetical protein